MDAEPLRLESPEHDRGAELRHLGAPYALTLCRLPLAQERAAGRVWPKGSSPTKSGTCSECWDAYAVLGGVFGTHRIEAGS